MCTGGLHGCCVHPSTSDSGLPAPHGSWSGQGVSIDLGWDGTPAPASAGNQAEECQGQNSSPISKSLSLKEFMYKSRCKRAATGDGVDSINAEKSKPAKKAHTE